MDRKKEINAHIHRHGAQSTIQCKRMYESMVEVNCLYLALSLSFARSSSFFSSSLVMVFALLFCWCCCSCSNQAQVSSFTRITNTYVHKCKHRMLSWRKTERKNHTNVRIHTYTHTQNKNERCVYGCMAVLVGRKTPNY